MADTLRSPAHLHSLTVEDGGDWAKVSCVCGWNVYHRLTPEPEWEGEVRRWGYSR